MKVLKVGVINRKEGESTQTFYIKPSLTNFNPFYDYKSYSLSCSMFQIGYFAKWNLKCLRLSTIWKASKVNCEGKGKSVCNEINFFFSLQTFWMWISFPFQNYFNCSSRNNCFVAKKTFLLVFQIHFLIFPHENK